MTSPPWPHEPSLLIDERIVHAMHLFNEGEWYAAHDGFEELWHEALGDERQVFQGIIQIAVAEHHHLNGNLRGSLLLLAEGLHHLQQSPTNTLGFDLAFLQSIVQERLSCLQSGGSLADVPLPQLKLREPD
jgi:predicted metal-dependent hydrolase